MYPTNISYKLLNTSKDSDALNIPTESPSTETKIPQPTVRKRERPMSARAPPPKPKTNEVASEEMTPSAAMPNIIVDSSRKDDEDDEFVVKAVESLKLVNNIFEKLLVTFLLIESWMVIK